MTITNVLLNGKLHSVNEWAGYAPRNRPSVFCPLCNERLTMRLGENRVYHAAHRRGSKCALTNPETAEHYNTKLLIWSELNQSRDYFVSYKCESCENKIRFNVFDYDYCEMEKSVNSIRPDITLFKNGKPCGAIEVLVTHAVDYSKRQKFIDYKLPWIEITSDFKITQWGNIKQIDYLVIRRCPDCYDKSIPIARSIICKAYKDRRYQLRINYAYWNPYFKNEEVFDPDLLRLNKMIVVRCLVEDKEIQVA
jgi:Competence protein CoiA-like family